MIMENYEVVDVLNQRSDDENITLPTSTLEEMQIIEDQTATSISCCCSCGDQYGEVN